MPTLAHQVRGHVANLAGAGAEVEYGVARLHITRGIAAAIILLDDFLRQHFQQAAVVIHRAA